MLSFTMDLDKLPIRWLNGLIPVRVLAIDLDEKTALVAMGKTNLRWEDLADLEDIG